MAAPYAATQITGTVGIDDKLAGKEIRDVDTGLYELVDQNNLHPFIAVMSSMSSGRTAKNYKVEWTQKDIFPHWDVVATGFSVGAADTACTVVVTNADYFKVGDVIEFPEATVAAAKINQAVVTVKSTTTLTIHPVDAAYGCAVVVAGERIHNMSDSSSEYSVMPGIKLVKDVQVYNYVHFMRVPYAVGVFQMGTSQYTGEELDEREEETFKEIKMQFERQAIWGERGKYTDTTYGVKLFMRGIVSWINQADGDNIYDWSAGMTEAQFDEWFIEGPGKFGSMERDWYVSAELLTHVHSWAKSKERILSAGGAKTDSLGLHITRYLAPNGKVLNIQQHHMFEQAYDGAGLIVDHASLDMRGFSENGNFQHHTNIQANDVPGEANEWRLISTVVVKRVEPHGWMHKGLA